MELSDEILDNFYFSVGSAKGGVSISPKTQMEVETDPEKLVKYCCGANIYVTGQDPELKPDSEYPDWLWTLRTDRKPPDLSELDPDSYYYWGRLRKMHRRRISTLMKARKIK